MLRRLLSVSCLPAAAPAGASGVNVITCHSAVWSGDTEMLLFSTSLPRRGSIMIDADSWSEWSYPSSQGREIPAGSWRRFQWKILRVTFLFPLSLSKHLLPSSSVTPLNDTKWPSIARRKLRPRTRYSCLVFGLCCTWQQCLSEVLIRPPPSELCELSDWSRRQQSVHQFRFRRR